MKNSILFVAVATTIIAPNSYAATWQWSWPVTSRDAAPTIEVLPLKYGKTWAYAVEIDDAPDSTLTVAQPLLASYQWNDAPPGITGGINRSFVGTAAVPLNSIDTGKSVLLSLEQVNTLKQQGWGVANHSYWHTGNHWDPTKALKPEDFKRELYWSQAAFAALIGNGRAATHFVYPNGDPGYAQYLGAYGLRSASRVGATSPHNLLSPKANLLDWNRNYNDEGYWSKQNNPLYGLPEKPLSGDFIIDFTHSINKDPSSANHKRWVERLNHIATKFGAKGDNSMWVAPTDEVVNYSLATKAAKVSVAAGKVNVDLPDSTPGSALTLKITGISENTALKAPEGGTLFRQGSTAWITTPIIGTVGAPITTPKLRRVYSGEVKNLSWDKPIAIAGVRIRQSGPVADGFALKLDALSLEDKVESLISEDKAKLAPVWGTWLLFPTVPDRNAPLAKELRVTTDKNLKTMEVWALAE